MAYKALYRTYRPTTFEEVAGQQHIVKTLQNALKTGKIAHAYIFAGPRGTGKTTMAKLFAKSLNCEEGTGHQCNNCRSCKEINEGSHPDVIELDAASNNSVEDIRDLTEKVQYGTILGKYKVYIIDEVHMLSDSAFNALLKTLEEPPEHVIFILATTEPHKILPTIISRCQRYDFTKVSDYDIKERIRTILDTENIEFNDEAVDLVVSLCDGGMRDALSILDQVLAYSGNTLNVNDILDIFSLESTQEKINLLKAISQHDVKDVLRRLDEYFTKGTDIKRLTDDLTMILKDILLYQNCNNSDYLQILNDNQINEIGTVFSYVDVVAMIDILMDASKDYKTVTAINPLFTITILKMLNLHNHEKEIKPIIREKEAEIDNVIPKENFVDEIKNDSKNSSDKTEIPTPTMEINPLANKIILKNVTSGSKYIINEDLMIKIMVTSKKDLKNEILDKWEKIKKYSLHPTLGICATYLIDCHPLVVNDRILVVEPKQNKIAENINTIENQENLQILCREVFGKQHMVYAVTRVESVNLQQKYMNLFQVKKLPKISDIILEYEGE